MPSKHSAWAMKAAHAIHGLPSVSIPDELARVIDGAWAEHSASGVRVNKHFIGTIEAGPDCIQVNAFPPAYDPAKVQRLVEAATKMKGQAVNLPDNFDSIIGFDGDAVHEVWRTLADLEAP